jgi:hypothetical protein
LKIFLGVISMATSDFELFFKYSERVDFFSPRYLFISNESIFSPSSGRILAIPFPLDPL